jgi:hypothetical protein
MTFGVNIPRSNGNPLLNDLFDQTPPAIYAAETPANMFVFNEITQTITGSSTTLSGAVVIPASINGVAVRTLAISSISFRPNITSIVIPEGVTDISVGSIRGNDGLVSVTIPSSVQSIGINAFQNNIALRNVTINSSLPLQQNLSGVSNPFAGCSNISATFNGNIPTIPTVFAGSGTALSSVTINSTAPNVTMNNTFSSSTSLHTVTINSNIASWSNPFNNTPNLRNVHFGDRVRNVPAIFEWNSTITNVTFSNSVTSIATAAFRGCVNLTSAPLPPNLGSLGSATFQNSGLTSLTIPSSLRGIPNQAFMNTRITSFTIPSTLLSISEDAFRDNVHLTNLVFEDISGPITVDNRLSITHRAFQNIRVSELTIPRRMVNAPTGGTAFINNPNLTTVTWNADFDPDVMFIDATDWWATGGGVLQNPQNHNTGPFHGCPNLRNVIYGPSVRIIAGHFRNTPITNVTIPYGVTMIGPGAFTYTDITSITIPNSVTHIGGSAFGRTGITSINIPNSVTHIGPGFIDYTEVTELVIPDSVIAISSGRFESQENQNGFARNARHLTSVVIGNGVTVIPGHAFSGVWEHSHTQLTSIVLGENITTIGNNAFTGTGITSINLPEGLETISANAFMDVIGLTEIALPASLKTIGAQAFYGTSLTSIQIPNGVTTIGDRAFAMTPLAGAAVVPDSVTSFGVSVFPAGITQLTLGASITTQINGLTLSAATLRSGMLPEWGADAHNTSPLPLINLTIRGGNIANNAFSVRNTLTHLTLGGGGGAPVHVGEYAFSNNINLANLTLGEGVTTIGNRAFFACSALPATISLPSTVSHIQFGAFLRSGCTQLISNRPISQTSSWAKDWNAAEFEWLLPVSPNNVAGTAWIDVVYQTNAVTFNANGAVSSVGPSTWRAALRGETYVLPTAEQVTTMGFTFPGSTFLGWNTRSDGSGIALTQLNDVQNDTTLFAQWSTSVALDPVILSDKITDIESVLEDEDILDLLSDDNQDDTYTASSWSTFTQAHSNLLSQLANAEYAVENASTQEEINDAYNLLSEAHTALLDAKDALVLSADAVFCMTCERPEDMCICEPEKCNKCNNVKDECTCKKPTSPWVWIGIGAGVVVIASMTVLLFLFIAGVGSSKKKKSA